MTAADHFIASCLVILAVWILLSGLDDLVLDGFALGARLRRRVRTPHESESGPEKCVAIFLPLWREERVVTAMLRHSIAAIRYRHYAIFAGCYPNDAPTLDAVFEAVRTFPNVHAAVCRASGPTSKADCLNFIYERMLEHERASGIRFDVVLVHDAEDVIHPDSLEIANRFCGPYDMVQLPVLPLATPLREWTHGVYCDEFAEVHGKDLPLRQMLGGFIPSAGVGTAYSRHAIDALAACGGPFDPDCVTEDYANGLRLHRAGHTQLFLPIRIHDEQPIATCEYFPHTFRQAVRQRTRWTAGIALQCWERHGWGDAPAQWYWLWRDRKGLLGNPVSLLSNLLCVYGAVTGIWSSAAGRAWGLAQAMPHPLSDWLLGATLSLLVLRCGIRAGFSARIYGWRFACAVPLRSVWANWINGSAALCAAAQYFAARLRRRRLAWRKTDHTYPPAADLAPHRRRIGEILVSMQKVRPADVFAALSNGNALRLGEFLVRTGRATEEDVYAALSLQHGVPFSRLDLSAVPEWIRGLLPDDVAGKWNVLPYRVGFGILFVAGPELPGPGMDEDLRRATGMQIRFQLVTPSDFERAGRAAAVSV